MNLSEVFSEKRKFYDFDESSDGSSVDTQMDHVEDCEDEESLYRKGGHFHFSKEYLQNEEQRYSICKKIKSSGFSSVFLVHSDENVSFALKIQKSAKWYRTSAREEIAIHDHLKNQKFDGKNNVCLLLQSFVHVGEFGKHYCMLFPLMDTDLQNVLDEKGPLGLHETCKIVNQSLNGLHFIHSCGFYHTDIKPDNIFISGCDAKIGDLGIACTIGSNENFLHAGNGPHTSPDSIMMHKNFGSGVDVWAMGCVFYECVSGEYLFNGKSDDKLLKCIFEIMGNPPKSYLEMCDESGKFRSILQKDRHEKLRVVLSRNIPDVFECVLKCIHPMLIWDLDRRFSALESLRSIESIFHSQVVID